MTADQTCTCCGKTGHQAHACPLRKREAHALLDGARAGLPVSAWDITRALQATGDLDTRRPVDVPSSAYWEAA